MSYPIYKTAGRKVGVVGGRNFDDYALMCKTLDDLPYPIDAIVSGGARGADTLAEKYAKERRINFYCFPPVPELVESRGFAFAAKHRNRLIVEHSDEVFAFPTKSSRGTWHTVSCAKELGKPVTVIGESG